MPGKNDIHNDPNHNTNGFDKNPDNINKKGRPLKIYTILKEQGYSKDDMTAAFSELAFYTLDDLKEIHNDESKPVITRIIANQFYLALQKGDWSKVKDILEQVTGKPMQKTQTQIEMPPERMKIKIGGKELEI